MDLNQLAKKIAEREGKKVPVNIAQIKEVLRITLTLLAAMAPGELEAILDGFRYE